MISEAFEVLENGHKIGTCIHSFKEYLASYINHDEEFYVGFISTFVAKVTSLTNKSMKNEYFPSNFKIKQIQAGQKGRIDIMKSLKEKCSPLKGKKSATFFKITDSMLSQEVHPQFVILH